MIHLLLLAILVCLKIFAFLMLGLALFVVCLGFYDLIHRELRSRRGKHTRPAQGGLRQPSLAPLPPPRVQNVENIVYLRDATEEEIEDAVVFMSDHRRRKR